MGRLSVGRVWMRILISGLEGLVQVTVLRQDLWNSVSLV